MGGGSASEDIIKQEEEKLGVSGRERMLELIGEGWRPPFTENRFEGFLVKDIGGCLKVRVPDYDGGYSEPR